MDYDLTGRATFVQEAYGSPAERQTSYTYSDAARTIKVAQDQKQKGDQLQQAVTHFDPLGRVWLTRKTDDSGGSLDPVSTSGGIQQKSRYLTQGNLNYLVTSNPYRGLSDPTMGWTLAIRDQMGRLASQESFDGSGLPQPWGTPGTSLGATKTGYLGTTTVTRDPENLWAKATVDALGRPLTVVEDPAQGSLTFADGTAFSNASTNSLTTQYTYDVYGNIHTVTQGSQIRTLQYDSLNRLVGEYHPEMVNSSGTQVPINYNGYDNNGNLTSRIDANSVTTTWSYDALDRPVTINYSDSTPAVTFCYDGDITDTTGSTNPADPKRSCVGAPPASTQGANLKGKLTQVKSSASATSYPEYDQLGRVTASVQNTPYGTGNPSYPFSYGYDLSGNLTSIQYPSGRVVSYDCNPAGHPNTVWNGLPNSTAYASNFTFTPHGALSGLSLHNGLAENIQYTSRLAASGQSATKSGVGLLSLGYTYYQNSNAKTQTITANSGTNSASWSESFTYDTLSRLSTVAETGSDSWSETFAYDANHNRWIDPSKTTGQPPYNALFSQNQNVFSPLTNRINRYVDINNNSAAVQ